MKEFLLTALASGLTVLVAEGIFAAVSASGFWAAFAFGLLLGVLNALVRPILMFLTFPINLLTLGLFTFVVNALVLWLAASLIAGVSVAGFWPAFFLALLVSAVSSLVETLVE
jgi:putative membrane protein